MDTGHRTTEAEMSIYDFSARLSTGEERHLADYRGKVLLVVNVASKCGFTPQYKGLQNLCEQFGPRGFEVLAFPVRSVRPSGAGIGCGDLCILRTHLWGHVSAVRQDRGQRQQRPPSLCL